jgi:hypothetical protein
MASRVGYSGSNQARTSLPVHFEHFFFFAGTGEVTFAILGIRILFNELCLHKLLNLILHSFQESLLTCFKSCISFHVLNLWVP